MACQLIGAEVLPRVVVKALVYPGAIKRSFMKGTTIPSPDQLFNSYKYNMRGNPVTIDLRQLEVIAGSYLCVAGALLGLIKRGRISLIGLILIIWGINKHGSEANCIYPEMIITLIIAFFSVRNDVRRLIGCCMPNCIVKRLHNYSKTKFN
ncbi:hypothetical protein PHJA_001696400 [Phtheirospermum japonicum]|uniref:Uncharacterized protein n=1 Tax=Phtheirospermum japonicum TaxID=374723 RepID=A0A830CMA0_9LAMI|nr:hypothetical protein PHJA_001696400 [Phtheirospermum japonicum]